MYKENDNETLPLDFWCGSVFLMLDLGDEMYNGD